MKEKHTILLVDDEQNILDSLSRILKPARYQVLTSNSAAEALSLLKKEKGLIDVILSDNKMPKMTGIEFLGKVKELFPDIIRIMLTGKSDVEDAKRAINEGGVYKFLTKPCEPDELKIAIRDALIFRKLWTDNMRLMSKVKEQNRIIHELEEANPGAGDIKRDETGRIILDEGDYYDSLDDFMKENLW